MLQDQLFVEAAHGVQRFALLSRRENKLRQRAALSFKRFYHFLQIKSFDSRIRDNA